MKNIGMNAVSRIAGACTPAATTIEPMTAANEYAGAVEAIPMISASTKPIALDLRPLPPVSGAVPGAAAPLLCIQFLSSVACQERR